MAKWDALQPFSVLINKNCMSNLTQTQNHDQERRFETISHLLNILQTTWEIVVEKITGLLRHGKKLQLSCKKELQKLKK